jgi:hypothetical protein
LREASQFDDDVLLPSNCGIPLLLAITEDLLLALTASVIGFCPFLGGSGSVDIEVAAGEVFVTWDGGVAVPTTLVVGATGACSLFFQGDQRLEGAGLRTDIPTRGPGLPPSPVVHLPPLAGLSSSRLA